MAAKRNTRYHRRLISDRLRAKYDTASNARVITPTICAGVIEVIGNPNPVKQVSVVKEKNQNIVVDFKDPCSICAMAGMPTAMAARLITTCDTV